MVGGKEEVFEQVKDILHAMGAEVTLVGSNGSGTTAKLANQVIVNLNIAAMSEALVLASKAGIDVEKMYQAIRGGLAGSSVLDAKVPNSHPFSIISTTKIENIRIVHFSPPLITKFTYKYVL